MTTKDHIPLAEESVQLFLEPGAILLAQQDSTIRTVLGSCVSVCLWDRELLVGGMNHFLYPRPALHEQPTARFGAAATLYLLKMMLRVGCEIENLVAQMYGGSFPEGASGVDIGLENIAVARAVLAKKKVPIVSEDVGGTMGRKVVFDITSGHAVVYKVHRLRRNDWVGEVW